MRDDTILTIDFEVQVNTTKQTDFVRRSDMFRRRRRLRMMPPSAEN